MRTVIVTVLLVVALALTGCISSTMVVRLKPDGSGTIVETTTMSSEMVLMMKGMVAGMAKEIGGKEASEKDMAAGDLFSEKDARAKASKLGQGVTFVSSEKINTADADGVRAVYQFADINQIRINEKPSTPSPGGMETSGPSAGQEVTFRFVRQNDGTSVLTIINPPPSSTTKTTETPAPAGQPGSGGPELAQLKHFLKGFKIARLLEIDGVLKKTNATHVEGNTVTLIDINFEALVSNEAVLSQLSVTKNPEDAKRILKDIKGIKVEVSPEVKVEFSAR